jgi:deaminated glutathione amidase
MKIALHQMCSGIQMHANALKMADGVAEAAMHGAEFYFAPEMSGLLDRNRERAFAMIVAEEQNSFLAMAMKAARENRIWIHIGSIPIRNSGENARNANRSVLIDPEGAIVARYDKMHLFDVVLDSGETWRESSAYDAGQYTVVAETPLGAMGLTICYDLRFPELYSRLAQKGASVFAVPSAFTVPTGKAHWHILLRARAIENAAFVIAAAQSGQHADGRETFGHSLVVDPWGDVLLDMGQGEGIGYAEIDLDRVDAVRRQIPVHINRREIPA